jgi:hypothetical protein
MKLISILINCINTKHFMKFYLIWFFQLHSGQPEQQYPQEGFEFMDMKAIVFL